MEIESSAPVIIGGNEKVKVIAKRGIPPGTIFLKRKVQLQVDAIRGAGLDLGDLQRFVKIQPSLAFYYLIARLRNVYRISKELNNIEFVREIELLRLIDRKISGFKITGLHFLCPNLSLIDLVQLILFVEKRLGKMLKFSSKFNEKLPFIWCSKAVRSIYGAKNQESLTNWLNCFRSELPIANLNITHLFQNFESQNLHQQLNMKREGRNIIKPNNNLAFIHLSKARSGIWFQGSKQIDCNQTQNESSKLPVE